MNATSTELISELQPPTSGTQLGGTERHLIRSISVTPTELRASLCSDGWDEFAFTAGNAYLGAGAELVMYTLRMQKAGPSPKAPPSAAQQALIADTSPTPAPAGRTPYSAWLKGPKDDVFNNWIATKWDVSVDPPADCVAWFKREHPGLKFPTGYRVESRPNRPASPPPSTLPGSPGW